MTAPPNMALSTISFRPQRSASAPQTGEATIMVSAWPENTRPVKTSVPIEVALPKDFTYSGRKGNMLENPIEVMTWQNTMMYRVLRQVAAGRWSDSLSVMMQKNRPYRY